MLYFQQVHWRCFSGKCRSTFDAINYVPSSPLTGRKLEISFRTWKNKKTIDRKYLDQHHYDFILGVNSQSHPQTSHERIQQDQTSQTAPRAHLHPCRSRLKRFFDPNRSRQRSAEMRLAMISRPVVPIPCFSKILHTIYIYIYIYHQSPPSGILC